MPTSNKKKYLIISPINRWGGVNIDVGFIAQTILGKGHELRVLSIGKYYEDSSIFDFIDVDIYDSVDRHLLHHNGLIRFCLRLIQQVKPMNIPLHHRLKNALTRRITNLRNKRQQVIDKHLQECDEVIICSQLTGEWNREIVQTAHRLGKKIHLRVTQQIDQRHTQQHHLAWLAHVTTFMHHSVKNLDVLAPLLLQAKHTLVDQCAVAESQFLSTPLLNQPIRSFYCLSRIEATKCIDQIITVFKQLSQPNISLHIYGDGSQLSSLKELANDDERIHFYGAVSLDQVPDVHAQHDCLIINSSIEGGPYTAIEAMAAGRMIASREVGAMMTRLGSSYPYFIEDASSSDLRETLSQVISLTEEEVSEKSKWLRQRYVDKYSVQKISVHYATAMAL